VAKYVPAAPDTTDEKKGPEVVPNVACSSEAYHENKTPILLQVIIVPRPSTSMRSKSPYVRLLHWGTQTIRGAVVQTLELLRDRSPPLLSGLVKTKAVDQS
jgi:hypothetical protein